MGIRHGYSLAFPIPIPTVAVAGLIPKTPPILGQIYGGSGNPPRPDPASTCDSFASSGSWNPRRFTVRGCVASGSQEIAEDTHSCILASKVEVRSKVASPSSQASGSPCHPRVNRNREPAFRFSSSSPQLLIYDTVPLSPSFILAPCSTLVMATLFWEGGELSWGAA